MESWDDVKFGELLNDHFYNLQKYKQISTAKIDRMVEICRENGAWGAKINGSGGKSSLLTHYSLTHSLTTFLVSLLIDVTVSCLGGGCMFCYIENDVEKIDAVKRAIEALGTNAYVISIDEGTK